MKWALFDLSLNVSDKYRSCNWHVIEASGCLKVFVNV